MGNDVKISVQTESSPQAGKAAGSVEYKKEPGVESAFASALAGRRSSGEKASKNEDSKKRHAPTMHEASAGSGSPDVAPKATDFGGDAREACGWHGHQPTSQVRESDKGNEVNLFQPTAGLTGVSLTGGGGPSTTCDATGNAGSELSGAGDASPLSSLYVAPCVPSTYVLAGNDSTDQKVSKLDSSSATRNYSDDGATQSKLRTDIGDTSKVSKPESQNEGASATELSSRSGSESAFGIDKETKAAAIESGHGTSSGDGETAKTTGRETANAASIQAATQASLQTGLSITGSASLQGEAAVGGSGSNPSSGLAVKELAGGQGTSGGRGKGGAVDSRASGAASEGKVGAAGASKSIVPVRLPEGAMQADSGLNAGDGAPKASPAAQMGQSAFASAWGQSDHGGDLSQTGGRGAATPIAAASPEAQPMPAASSAQLIQSLQHSEMRVGMHSAEFGDISISTSLSRQALSAQISTDHGELGRALAIHMPAMEERLSNAYGVQARVEVRDGNKDNGSSYNNSGQQPNDDRQSRSGRSSSPEVLRVERTSVPSSFITSDAPVRNARLDIRI